MAPPVPDAVAKSPWLAHAVASPEARDRFAVQHEFVPAARSALDDRTWNYLRGGSETETALRRNRAALDSLAFSARVLVDVSETDASADFFGRRIRLPVALAPVGALQSFHSKGGAAAAEGAGAFGVPMIQSSVSAPSLEKVAAAGPGPKVFQLYVRGGDDFIDQHVERAITAGYDAFAITVDTAVISRRERDLEARWVKAWADPNTAPMKFQAALTWAQIERVRRKYPGVKLILKGIQRADDAVRAAEMGIDVVYVSNHGGRQLDHARGSIEVLPEVVRAVRGRAKVWVDGGFARGSDVVKAIALGADLVVVGRLYLYALSADGPRGITRMLELLEDEVHQILALIGAPTLAHLDPSMVVRTDGPVVQPGVLSAFPLLEGKEKL
ncbi:L-lactate dehydrogenase [Hyaloraphidium curvatum]|nr:L-lactate dehydrogenase [Hyaloraphidium curvatum]